MIIDCHCHVLFKSNTTGDCGVARIFKNYLARAAKAGIQRTVLFAPFHPNYSKANNLVAQIVEHHYERFIGFTFVHPMRDSGRIMQMVYRMMAKYGFCGIKVHRHDGQITHEICKTARALSLPVLYDIMGETSMLKWLASLYPDVQFIIPHLGSFADNRKAQLTLIDNLVLYKNIHADTSAVRNFDMLKRAINTAGPTKILFGSDGPWLHPGLELAKVNALELPEDDRQYVLSGNLLRLLKPAWKLMNIIKRDPHFISKV